jgi:hypothetical protein
MKVICHCGEKLKMHKINLKAENVVSIVKDLNRNGKNSESTKL